MENVLIKKTHAICAGLDVHKDILAVSVRTEANGEVQYIDISTTTSSVDVSSLSEKLKSLSCFHVCMEETGKYTNPVFNILSQNGINVQTITQNI
jgi:aspartokinase